MKKVSGKRSGTGRATKYGTRSAFEADVLSTRGKIPPADSDAVLLSDLPGFDDGLVAALADAGVFTLRDAKEEPETYGAVLDDFGRKLKEFDFKDEKKEVREAAIEAASAAAEVRSEISDVLGTEPVLLRSNAAYSALSSNVVFKKTPSGATDADGKTVDKGGVRETSEDGDSNLLQTADFIDTVEDLPGFISYIEGVERDLPEGEPRTKTKTYRLKPGAVTDLAKDVVKWSKLPTPAGRERTNIKLYFPTGKPGIDPRIKVVEKVKKDKFYQPMLSVYDASILVEILRHMTGAAEATLYHTRDGDRFFRISGGDGKGARLTAVVSY